MTFTRVIFLLVVCPDRFGVGRGGVCGGLDREEDGQAYVSASVCVRACVRECVRACDGVHPPRLLLLQLGLLPLGCSVAARAHFLTAIVWRGKSMPHTLTHIHTSWVGGGGRVVFCG